ncbi:SsrA-binding protein SmpB [candidate division KSB1 bacterium]
MNEPDKRVIVRNRRARHDFHVLSTLEAGISLTGTEVKSIRAGKVNLKESYARIEGGEVFLIGMHISHYDQGNRFNHEPKRNRRLLLSRHEIRNLDRDTEKSGLTLVPLAIYLKGKLVKVELALARGKKQYDKRQDMAEREAAREMERALKRDASN